MTDSGELVGIDRDGFENHDKFTLHLMNLLKSSMGASYAAQLNVGVVKVGDVPVARVDCPRSRKPVFLLVDRSGHDQLFVRTGPSSTQLGPRELADYLKSHFDAWTDCVQQLSGIAARWWGVRPPGLKWWREGQRRVLQERGYPVLEGGRQKERQQYFVGPATSGPRVRGGQMRFSQVNSLARSLARIAEVTGTTNVLPGLLVTDHERQKKPICAIATDPRDKSSTVLIMQAGEEEGRIVAKTIPNGPTGVHLKIPGWERSPLQLSLLPTGQPVVMLQTQDCAKVALTVDPADGTAAAILADSAGKTRARLGLSSTGEPELVFFDAEGNETWRAG